MHTAHEMSEWSTSGLHEAILDTVTANVAILNAEGEIVAVKASTGEVLAVAQHQASGVLPAAGALDAKLVPGAAFTGTRTLLPIEMSLAPLPGMKSWVTPV